MKSLLLVCCAWLAFWVSNAQGIFNASNNYTPTGSSKKALILNTDGNPIAAVNGRVEFIDLNTMKSLSPNGSSGVPLTLDGLFFVNGLVVPSVPIGGTADILMRAWDVTTGPTYASSYVNAEVLIQVRNLGGGTTPAATFADQSNFKGLRLQLTSYSLVSFNNAVLGSGGLVYDSNGKALASGNFVAQLYMDTFTGLKAINGTGTGRFGTTPGVWDGGLRSLVGISYGQPVQLEVRIWDISLYSSYELAVTKGGITGTSGLFDYSYSPSGPITGSGAWMKNLTSIRLTSGPTPPPLIESIQHPTLKEGQTVTLEPQISGGTPPLKYLWQLAGGVQVTNKSLVLEGSTLRPGLIDLNLTVSDAEGRVTPAAAFRLDVENQAPVIRKTGSTGAIEGQQVSVTATADFAWPPSAVRALWTLNDGRTAEGLNSLLPLLPPGKHTVQLKVSELGLVSLYDNLDSVSEPAEYHLPSAETGDEIQLSQTGKTIHEVSIYYFADLSGMTPAERAKAGGKLRIYRQDGSLYPGLKSRTPGTLLYESPVFGLNSGYFLQRFTEVNVAVEDRLTWTVVWNDLPQTAGKNAGLVVGDTKANPAPSNTGTSYNDFWVREGDRWELYHLGNFRPVANFASRATAVGTQVAAMSLTVPVSFQVTNVPPVITTVGTPTELSAAESGEFRISASDVGPEELSYEWTFGDGVKGKGAVTTHAYNAVGTFKGQVKVTDPYGGEATQAFTVKVGADRRPLVFVGTPAVDVLQDLNYFAAISVNPPGVGQTITLKAVTVPAWLQWKPVTALSGELVGRPGNADVGTHVVVLEANDGTTTERLSFSIAVLNQNDAPTLALPSSVTVPARKGLEGIAVQVADPDAGDQLTVTATSGNPKLLPSDRLVISGTGGNRTLSILPTTGTAGTVAVEVAVTDGSLTTRKTLSVTLEAPPEFSVTVAKTPGGTVELSPAASQYEEGFRILAKATPGAGWQLNRWLGLPEGPVTATSLDLEWTVTTNTVLSGEFVDIAAPSVLWISPAPGIVPEEVVTLRGRVTDNDTIVKAQLTRPGLPALPLTLQDGGYEVQGVRLDQGENNFVIVASDAAGNTTTNETVLVWSPGSVLVVGNPPEAREGQTVSFPIQLQSQQSLSGMTFNLNFPDYVDFLGSPQFEPSGLLPGALISANTNVPGQVKVTIATAGDYIPQGLHNIGTLKLRVRSLFSPIGLQVFVDPELLEVSDEFGSPVPGVGGISGQTRLLPRRVIGDLNGNNRIDIGDAGLLQRLVVGLDSKRSWDTALNDLNKNGSLDSGDVVKVMRVVIGQDPQPKPRTAGADWPTPRKVRTAGMPSEWLEITPSTLTAKRGELFEVQVRVKQGVDNLRGISFELAYPPQLLALMSPGGYVAGKALPSVVVPYWSSNATEGRLNFGMMSETNQVVTADVLATFRFRVSSTVPPNWQGEFGLRNVEFTLDGYTLDQTDVAPGSVGLAGEILAPKINRLRLNDGGAIQLDVLANQDSTLVIEASSDLGQGLRGWRPMGSQVYKQLPIYLPGDATGSTPPEAQFYRVRASAPALLTTQPQGGSRTP